MHARIITNSSSLLVLFLQRTGERTQIHHAKHNNGANVGKNDGSTPPQEPDKKYRSKAEEYLKDQEKTEELLKKARDKMSGKKRGPLQEVWETLLNLFRLISAYAKGTYRETPWTSLVMMVAAIVYFVSPIDAILDAIPILGYVDDASVLAWTAKTCADDINAFVDWEAAQVA
jgi:uncharacterized membrane protein YkvA (DUF1232 family)